MSQWHKKSHNMPRYNQALLLSGGGHSYPSLLGRYQALLDSGYQPDLLIATCGGSIIANLIRLVSSSQERLAWLSSPLMHQFWLSQQPGPGNKLHKVLSDVILRKLKNTVSNKIPDVFNTWLFDFKQSFPAIPKSNYRGPDILILGSQLNFTPDQIGTISRDNIYSTALFCNTRILSLVKNCHSIMASHSTKISKDFAIYDSIDPITAMRISIADCYYYSPVNYQDKFFIGGLIDLFPIELAKHCAENVIAERKPHFDTLMAKPAIKHVFGFDPQVRLEQFHAHQDITWLEPIIDKLPKSIKKQANFFNNTIDLIVDDYAQFEATVLAQYQMGYHCTLQQFREKK